MDAQIEGGFVNGAYGLWRVQGGANSDVTHIAFVPGEFLAPDSLDLFLFFI